MKRIETLLDVWDNHLVTPVEWGVLEARMFKEQTGAKRIVAVRWTYDGQEHESRYYAHLLPDQTGLVHYDSGDPHSKRLIVLNGDGTERVAIAVPRVDANSRPEEGYLCLPPSSARFGGIEWGCEGNDGHTDYLFDFDWRSGALLRYARPTRPW